jgi:hypothetical protein
MLLLHIICILSLNQWSARLNVPHAGSVFRLCNWPVNTVPMDTSTLVRGMPRWFAVATVIAVRKALIALMVIINFKMCSHACGLYIYIYIFTNVSTTCHRAMSKRRRSYDNRSGKWETIDEMYRGRHLSIEISGSSNGNNTELRNCRDASVRTTGRAHDISLALLYFRKLFIIHIHEMESAQTHWVIDDCQAVWFKVQLLPHDDI